MKIIIIASVILSLMAALAFYTFSSASQDKIDENGLDSHGRCLVEANDSFLQYLEDNSTTYKFDDGTVINLPNYDSVIDEAKQVLKAQEQEC